MGFPGGSVVKNSSAMQETACIAEDVSSIPGLGRSPGEGNGNPLQDLCLDNPTDRGARKATVHGVTWVGHDLATKPSPPPSSGILHYASFVPTLLLLSHFSHVRLCATPSLGFSRQEHWSGLPFPSPMHKSEKWKWSRSVVSDSSRPHGLQPTRLLCPWDFPGKSTGVGCHCLLCVPPLAPTKVPKKFGGRYWLNWIHLRLFHKLHNTLCKQNTCVIGISGPNLFFLSHSTTTKWWWGKMSIWLNLWLLWEPSGASLWY